MSCGVGGMGVRGCLGYAEGVFDLNVKLSDIARDVEAIKRLLEDDEEEEGPEDS